MQFFGDVPERGWVNECSLVTFEGLPKFQEYCAMMAKKCPKTKDKMGYVLHLPSLAEKVKSGKWKRWDGAVKAAAEALPFSRNERKQKYTFEYEDAPPKTDPAAQTEGSSVVPNGEPPQPVRQKRKYTKRKLDNLSSPQSIASETEPPPKRRRKLREKIDSEILQHSTLLKDVKDQEAAQFSIYYVRKKDTIRREHPGFTEKQIDESIYEEWNKMDSEQKAQFQPMGNDESLGEVSPGEGKFWFVLVSS